MILKLIQKICKNTNKFFDRFIKNVYYYLENFKIKRNFNKILRKDYENLHFLLL